jgi:hypothetical protein
MQQRQNFNFRVAFASFAMNFCPFAFVAAAHLAAAAA